MTGIPRLSGLLVREEDDVPPAQRSRRDWWIDSVLFLLAIVFGTVSLVHSYHRGLHGALFVIDLTCGVVLCLALWGRRRGPFVLGLASLVILPISSFAGPAGVIILYTVAANRRWQLAFLIAAGQLALLPAGRAIHPQGNSLATYYIGGILGTAAVVAWGMFRRGRLQTQRERQRRTQAEEQLRVEQIRHAERERIAREMHDVLAHRISLLSLHAGALEIRPDAPPEEIARAAAVIRASAHEALEDLRSVIGVLRYRAGGVDPQPPQPTLAALPDLLDESRAAGMRLSAEVRVADPTAVPDAVGRHALRIVQEALTNARKHAGSAPVDLLIEGAPGEGLTIEVRNPAPVLAAAATQIPGSGTGLVGLAERAALSGGELEHGLDGQGDFRLRAWLPWSS
ncbi:MAG: sensor histidine kinase [Solirubrobacterales bacterium]|nr:sensor histidine kinase [Solirubrobacterales bacterium]